MFKEIFSHFMKNIKWLAVINIEHGLKKNKLIKKSFNFNFISFEKVVGCIKLTSLWFSVFPFQQLHSDVDKGDGKVKYVLSGEGATSIFTIDENTGDIHATKRLDREAQAYYTLQAQAVDRLTNLPVEPRSEFVIKVQDINDNEPKFLDGPYLAGVPEMSPLGEFLCSFIYLVNFFKTFSFHSDLSQHQNLMSFYSSDFFFFFSICFLVTRGFAISLFKSRVFTLKSSINE